MKRALSRCLGMILFCIAQGAHALPPLPIQAEIEPNDTFATATLLRLNGGRAVAGGVITAGDADYFQLAALPVNSKIWIYVDTGGTQNAGSTTRDSIVSLYGADGTTLIESDNNDGVGNGLDGVVEAATASAITGRTLGGGTHYIKVTSGQPTGVIDPYRLYVVVTRTNMPLAEVEPNDTANFADVLVAPGATTGVRTGSIGLVSDVDLYRVSARGGDILMIGTDADPSRIGAAADIVTQLLGLDAATVLVSCPAGPSGDAAGCGVGYRVTNSGTYYIRVQQNNGGTGAYALMAANMTLRVVDAVPEIEPNDSLATANVLALDRGRAIAAGVLPPGDEDWWRVDINNVSTRLYALVETGGPTSGTTRDSVLTIYKADGTVLQMDDNSGTGNGLDDTIESSLSSTAATFASLGTFYLKVAAADPSQTLEYRLLVAVTPYEGNGAFEVEPNDTPGTATPVFVGSFDVSYEQHGSVNGAGDVDYYRVSANAGDVLFAAIDSHNVFTHTGVDMVINLYATDGTTLLMTCDSGSTGTDLSVVTEGCAYQVGRPGTYYFAVHPFFGNVTSGDYTLMVANMTPPGAPELYVHGTAFAQDTPDKAVVLTLNGGRAVGRGRINPVGDLDYWRIDGVLPNSKIWAYVDTGVNTTGLTTDSNLVLYQADGTTQIEVDDDDGTGNALDGSIESLFASVIAGRTLTAGGTYYLRVGHYNNSSTIDPYQIYVAVTPSFLIVPEAESNGSRINADVILQPGGLLAARTGTLAASDADYFKFTADAGDVFLFALDANPARATTGDDFVLDILDEDGGAALLTCDSSTQSTTLNSAAEGCAFRFPQAGVYYALVRGKTGTDTGDYALMVANMSRALTLDVDLSYPHGLYDALTDGLLAVRHMTLPANTNITAGTISASAARSPQEIKDYLDLLTTALDVDGDGIVDPATDGVLILRYMLGIRGIRLIENAVSAGATRTQYGDLLLYLQNLMPQ